MQLYSAAASLATQLAATLANIDITESISLSGSHFNCHMTIAYCKDSVYCDYSDNNNYNL